MPATSRTFGQCVNFSWVSIYVSIYIISANLHAFLLLRSFYRGVLLNFACYYILIRIVFAEWFWGQLCRVKRQYYDQIWIRGAVKDKVKVRTTDVSRFFGATNVSLRWWCCRYGYPYDVRNMISQHLTKYELPRSPRYWRYIYDVIELEWSRGHSVLSCRS